MRVRAAPYSRQSKVEHRKKLVEGVEAQTAETITYAEVHDMEIVGVFKDNLTASRFSAKDRPDFLRLMSFIRAGKVDVVLVTEQSRLDRQLWNILELIELARETPFKQIVKTRDDEVLDLSTESGINRVIDQANRDRHESELISQRVKAKKKQRAREGKYDGGKRPFGFEEDGETLRPGEAKVLRECAGKLLKGATLGGIARELNERGIPTANGHRWDASAVRHVFRSKRIIGIRTHEGVEYPAVWPAIISQEEWDEIQLILDSRAGSSRNRNGRSYLLTGLIFCGVCGAALLGYGSSWRGVFKRRYYCKPETSRGLKRGCGKIARQADPIEALITNAVLYRLDTTAVAEALGRATQSQDMAETMAEYKGVKASLKELLEDYYRERNKYAREEMLKLKASLEAELESLTDRMSHLESNRAWAQVPFGAKVSDIWTNSTLDFKRNLISLVVEKIVVQSGRPGGTTWEDEETGREWHFDPDLIEVVWRV